MTVESPSDVWVRSTCSMCFNSCGIKVHLINGVVVKIEGDPDFPHNFGRLCAKGNAAIMDLYSPNRIKVPLKRTNPEKGIGVDPKWVEISWEEAYDTVVEKFKKVREDDPRKAAMMCFDLDINSISGVFTSFLSGFGTPNMWWGGAGFYCGNGIHTLEYQTLGTFSMDPDLEYCNYLLLIGSQTGFGQDSTATLRARKMADALARGMKLVVVDPICTEAASKATEWIPIRPGTDAALALAMTNVLLNEEGIYDAEFLKKYTNGPYLIGEDGHYLRDKTTGKPLVWDVAEKKAKTYDDESVKEFALEGNYKVNGKSGQPAFQLMKDNAKKYTCEMASKITTIPAETIRRIAKEFGEAARIGSTIVLQGKKLPYRPAHAYYRRGVSGQKHSLLTCQAIHMLNEIVGSLDVPGGLLGTSGMMLPNDNTSLSWQPTEAEDGMMVGGMRFRLPGFPAREVKPPDSMDVFSLFPVASYSETMTMLTLPEPEKYKLPYKIEALLHIYTNIMMSEVNPEQVEAKLKAIPFQVSLHHKIDETAEFADIIIPITQQLERLDMFTNRDFEAIEAGMGDWYFGTRHPMSPPPPNVKSPYDVLIDLADRIGFLKDFNHMCNILPEFSFKEPYVLDLDRKYTWEEIADIWAKSTFGPEHDLAWFKEHGFIKWPKKIEEAYPRSFLKARIPVYYEHYIKAGEEVKRVTEEMDLPDWDVSDYQPLSSWKPGPDYEGKLPKYDLYAVNFRLPFHTFSFTADNVWLEELSEYHPYAYHILMNTEVAKKKGLRDGDLVRVETEDDGVEGRIKVTETVHPEVIGIGGCFGHWAKGMPVARGKGIHYNRLITASPERIDFLSSAIDCCIKTKVTKIG